MTAAQLPIHINNCLQASPTADISPLRVEELGVQCGSQLFRLCRPTRQLGTGASWHFPHSPQREPDNKENALGASAACSIGDDTPSHELSLSQMSGPGLQACKKTSVVSSQS